METKPVRLDSIVYVSKINYSANNFSIDLLILQSLRRNSDRKISSALYYDRQIFLQLIEGPPDQVDPLFIKISEDERHADLFVLHRSPAKERRFADWALKVVDGERLGGLRGYFAYDRLMSADCDALWRRMRLLERL